MRRIPLRNQQHKVVKYTFVSDCDYEMLMRYRWHLDSQGYAGARIDGVLWRMHRFIMKPPKGMVVDHDNDRKLDNQRDNIQICTPSQNQMKRRLGVNNRWGYRGIFKTDCNKWKARIMVNYKEIHLGNHKTKEEAARAYDEAAKKYYGRFARLNFPDSK